MIHSIKAFIPLLRASTAPLKKVVVLNSGVADIHFNLKAEEADAVAYAMTKAATLVAAAKFAVQLKKDNIVVVSFHPGSVNTWETWGDNGESLGRRPALWAMGIGR